jgi:hypothetical protein
MQGQVTTKTVKAGKPQKDRLGSAIASMILGIFASIFTLFAIITSVNESYMGYTSDIGATYMIIAGVFSLVGFPMGLRARKSTRGRGMAIAGIILTFFPFMFLILALIAFLLLFF